jgi:hypothetical protein
MSKFETADFPQVNGYADKVYFRPDETNTTDSVFFIAGEFYSTFMSESINRNAVERFEGRRYK